MSSLATQLRLVIEKAWYEKAWWLIFLMPFTYLYGFIVRLRATLYEREILPRETFKVPVIVVGNIIAGGAGKTPLVIAIADYLTDKGFIVGVISRGYKANVENFPYELKKGDKADLVGDEPALLKHKLSCPVVIDPMRTRAIEYLIKQHDCQFVICDDGLQHFALKPALSIVVHPSNLKNTYCLPAGPLREPLYRLKSYDVTVDASLIKSELTIINKNNRPVASDVVADEDLVIMTAIARPERFVSSLNKLGITGKVKLFPDHHAFKAEDFALIKKPIIMTEKDWVKFKLLNLDQDVYIACLNVEAEATVLTAVDQLILEKKRKAA